MQMLRINGLMGKVFKNTSEQSNQSIFYIYLCG